MGPNHTNPGLGMRYTIHTRKRDYLFMTKYRVVNRRRAPLRPPARPLGDFVAQYIAFFTSEIENVKKR